VQWLDVQDESAIDYRVDPARAQGFYAAIRRYWPALPDGALHADYSGVRPKLDGPGAPSSDFRIDGPRRHGIAGLINLLGIESPGLTSCLAIGEHVAMLAAQA
jgi:L-2-hydroxyglutarate oxidase LhgO